MSELLTHASPMYWFADEPSATYAIIRTCMRMSDAAWSKRRRMVRDVCGIKRDRKDIQIVYRGDRWWAISTPDEMRLPDPWSLTETKGDRIKCWRPNRRMKGGTSLLNVMQSDEYMVATAASVSDATGIKPFFNGFAMYSAGFVPAKGGYVIKGVKGHKMPSDCVRISDVDAENLINSLKARGVNG